MIAMYDQANKNIPQELINKMRDYGLEFALVDVESKKFGYAAVVENGKKLYEEFDSDKVSVEFEKDNKKFIVESAGFQVGKMCKIEMDGVNYAVSKRGFNICIYDSVEKDFISSICIDYFDGELQLKTK